MIYIYVDTIKSRAIIEVSKHLNNGPITYIPLEHNHELVIPDDASMIGISGVLRGNRNIIHQAIKRRLPWLYLDNGYLGKYRRVTVNSTTPTRFKDGKRFEHNTKLSPWRGGQGENILILPPSPSYMDTFGLRDFINGCIHTLNNYTDRPIEIRPKPFKERKAPDLKAQLDRAYAVISWGSALSLDALKLGIPTISLGWCPAKYSSFNLEDLDTSKVLNEPPRMETIDNLTWSSFDWDEIHLAAEEIFEEKTQFDYYYPGNGELKV